MEKQLNDIMPLSNLLLGDKCKVNSLIAHGPIRRRLLDIGLIPKTVVFIRKVAPLGDPIEINLRGFELTLRKEDAKKIEVEVL